MRQQLEHLAILNQVDNGTILAYIEEEFYENSLAFYELARDEYILIKNPECDDIRDLGVQLTFSGKIYLGQLKVKYNQKDK